MKRWIHSNTEEVEAALGVDPQLKSYLEDLAMNDVGEGYKLETREFSHALQQAGFNPTSRAFNMYSKLYNRYLKEVYGAEMTEDGCMIYHDDLYGEVEY